MDQQFYIELEDRLGAHNYKPLDVVLGRGQGVWVWDVDGTRYMDCLSAYSAVNQGHCHPRILETMIDQARKRLTAMRQYNQLGAGFRIAMRDLELRGAGNLLGPQQSGHIAGVGFELYCDLLRQSISRLKGEAPRTLVRATLRFDFVVIGQGGETSAYAGETRDRFEALKEAELSEHRTGQIEAFIPLSYIA